MGERIVSDWRQSKRWSDQFIPAIKRVLGEHLIGEPPQEEDAERNTDLIVLRLEAIRIACRIRRANFLQEYPNEFTIRSSVPSGYKTEITKIIEGWGRYFFYGFAMESGSELAAWALCDLHVFRLWHQRYIAGHQGVSPGIERENGDGTKFRAYQIFDLPTDFVIARQESWLTPTE